MISKKEEDTDKKIQVNSSDRKTEAWGKSISNNFERRPKWVNSCGIIMLATSSQKDIHTSIISSNHETFTDHWS